MAPVGQLAAQTPHQMQPAVSSLIGHRPPERTPAGQASRHRLHSMPGRRTIRRGIGSEKNRIAASQSFEGSAGIKSFGHVARFSRSLDRPADKTNGTDSIALQQNRVLDLIKETTVRHSAGRLPQTKSGKIR
jgi:hypothetical protein